MSSAVTFPLKHHTHQSAAEFLGSRSHLCCSAAHASIKIFLILTSEVKIAITPCLLLTREETFDFERKSFTSLYSFPN